MNPSADIDTQMQVTDLREVISVQMSCEYEPSRVESGELGSAE